MKSMIKFMVINDLSRSLSDQEDSALLEASLPSKTGLTDAFLAKKEANNVIKLVNFTVNYRMFEEQKQIIYCRGTDNNRLIRSNLIRTPYFTKAANLFSCHARKSN